MYMRCVPYGISEKRLDSFQRKDRHLAGKLDGELCSEYIELLSSSSPGSEKFWALDKRLRHDKSSAGVSIEMSRSEMPFNILRLLDEGAITIDDLSEFSDEMRASAASHIETSI